MDDHPWMITMITSVAVRIAEGGSKGGGLGGAGAPPSFRSYVRNVGRKKIGRRCFFETFELFGVFTALERSENGLGRSGIIRRHSEMTWNAWNSLKIIKNHSTIMRKHLNIDQKSSMGTKGLRV